MPHHAALCGWTVDGDCNPRCICCDLGSVLYGKTIRSSPTGSLPSLLPAANTGRFYRSCIVSETNPISDWMLTTPLSIVCCALSMAVWLHNEPFAASLSGVCTASGRHCSNEQVGVRASQVVSEKALSLASSEATSYGCRPTPTVAARARTSWLPPLLFQLPANITSSYPLQTSASSIAAPTRPLIRRSQSTSASVTSSSFYSRSSASSDTTISHQPSAIGTTSYRAEDLSTYGPPSSKSQAFGKPEVPPIPEKWRTAGRGLPPAVRPSRPGTRPGLPPPTCWQYNAEYGDSSSWMTETTPSADRGRRDPSTSRYPIMYPAPGSNIFPGDVDGMLERRIGACRSSENLRRSGSTQAASKGLATAGWLDLDDRADRSFTKGKAKGKERRTLVKKRQPRDL